MNDVHRILDANANRAREAMRVMEEAARFALDDAELSERLKALRHDLAAALGAMATDLPLARDTPGDVGTHLSTEGEGRRADLAAVAVAAGKRLSEALRSLEEYGKLVDPAFARRLEALRYRGYAIETDLHARLARPDPRRWRLCVLITESLCTHHPWSEVAAACLDAGADCLQFREKQLDDAELLHRTERLVEMAARYRRTESGAGDPPTDHPHRDRHAPRSPDRPAIIVNDRPDIARLAGADGVHLGQNDLPIDRVRRLFGHRLLIGSSTHDLDEAAHAVDAGCDYCGVGAMFTTATKDREPSGPAYLTRFVERYPTMPHLAIGGVTPETVDAVVEAGGRAVAVSACVCSAADPAGVVRKLLDRLP